MNQRAWARAAIFVALPLSCGGRVLERSSDANGGAPSNGGALSSGGAPSKGGMPSHGGAPAKGGAPSNHGGAIASAGSAPTAGMGPCLCLDIGCSPGFAPVPPAPGQCCSSECRLDCTGVECSAIDLDCKTGWHVGTLPDECCPLCVPDVPIPCEEAMKRYDAYREERIANYQMISCEQPGNGCSFFGEDNRCRQTCGTPIPYKQRDFIEEDLGNFAADYCSQCPKPYPIPCPAPPPSRCINDVCSSEIGAK
ncbi:MAG TPA: hypothetical protein VHB79_33150 [Polyangiaceae bacterium]|nr:hypothetical protein [Polyangiaceae bacterium]